MGNNEVRLVEGYIELREELIQTTDPHRAEVLTAKMEGIVFAYETYMPHYWDTFEYLLDRYKMYKKER